MNHEVLVFASVTAIDIQGFELEFSVFCRFDCENEASGKYFGVRLYVLFEENLLEYLTHSLNLSLVCIASRPQSVATIVFL